MFFGVVMTEEENLLRAWTARRLEREARLRLFPSLHQLPEEEVCIAQRTWHRASGAQYCAQCNLTYREHPTAEEWRIAFGENDDKRLCNGDVVHL
jgi:hypothetical protein